MEIKWNDHLSKFLDRLTDVLSGAFGAAVYHFMSEKRDQDGKVVVDKDGKSLMTLDSDKIRAHAPYFVLGLSDEAEFNALVCQLDPGQQKNLEIQMGPILGGPYPLGVPLHVPGLGDHQRADIILTIVQANVRNPSLTNGKDPREDTVKILQTLGDIHNPMEWKRRAVAFKLMKEREQNYIGARLMQEASQAIRDMIQEFRTAKAEWDNWINDRAQEMDVWTNNMRHYLRARQHGFWATLRRMFDLPWQQTR